LIGPLTPVIFQSFHFALIKPVLKLNDIAHRRIPICSCRSAYIGPIVNFNRVDAQDAKYPTMSVLYTHYTASLTGFQIGILRGAGSIQLNNRFIKQNFIFEGSQKLKGKSEKFKNQ
jgi:hypothetical protein